MKQTGGGHLGCPHNQGMVAAGALCGCTLAINPKSHPNHNSAWDSLKTKDGSAERISQSRTIFTSPGSLQIWWNTALTPVMLGKAAVRSASMAECIRPRPSQLPSLEGNEWEVFQSNDSFITAARLLVAGRHSHCDVSEQRMPLVTLLCIPYLIPCAPLTFFFFPCPA